MWKIEPTFCTFIIPSLGRPSLRDSIQSVLDQPDWNWRCNIVFDGVEPVNITGLNPDINYLEDNHFIVNQIDKVGNAGEVRNSALSNVNTTWTAFLDDDDTIAKSYLDRLKYYSGKQPELDIIIFTYRDITNGNIQPPKGMKDIKYCNVGISFAIKTSFVKEHNLQFVNTGIEDFYFLDSARKAGAKYLVTGDIQYIVGKRSAWS